MTTEFMMTLKKSLCRPIQVATGNWATTDAVGANLMSNEIPKILLDLPIVQRKLDGFQGVRGSITLRLQATANPFQQGILMLQFYPMQAQDTSYTGRALQPESWSFWPSVELNLGKETACEMRIPFTLPVSFIDLVTAVSSARPQMGAIYVKVYSPLKTGAGTATVGWNLYAHWNEDDLELFNPTPNVYQSGQTKSLVKHSRLPAENEKKSSSISSSLAAGATLAEAASAIPVLSAVAGPTEWALRCASRVASALGFSRPPVDAKPNFVVPLPYPFQSNVEGPDVSMPLSLTIQPGLKFEPTLGGKTEDEMSIDYFVTKFGYNATVNIDPTDVAGTCVFNLSLGPLGSQTANEASYPKPFQLLGKIFQFWRGNIRVRCKFAKTKLHTARLMFAFLPGVLNNTTLAACEYVHREIVDVGNVDELVYELPYTAQFPYLLTQNTGTSGCYGSFQILVVNPVTAPSTVANNFDIIIETAMGEGSEWFCPSPMIDLVPTVPVGTLVSPPTRPERSIVNQAQSGSTGGLVQVSTLSDAKVTGHQTETAQLCVGEKLLSLRQLVKYPANLATSQIAGTQTMGGTGTFAPVVYNPWAIGAVDALGANGVRCRDFLNVIAPYYRFSRGGMRVRGQVLCTTTNETSAAMTFSCKSYPGNAIGVVGFDPSANTNTWGGDTWPLSNQGLFSYTLPAWQTVPMVDHHYAITTTVGDSSLLGRQSCLSFRGYGFASAEVVNWKVARQPADDYELIGFIGPPQFTLLP